MKYLILAMMPSLFVGNSICLCSFVDAFKKYVDKKTRNFFLILIEILLITIFVIVYLKLTDFNFYATYGFFFCILIFFFCKIEIYYNKARLNPKSLGYSFIALQLYSILSWWFV
jgi:hypothetical protein